MTYVFRWRCPHPAATITITVEALSDRQAGELAAALVHDFVRGRHRELTWEPQVPVIDPYAHH